MGEPAACSVLDTRWGHTTPARTASPLCTACGAEDTERHLLFEFPEGDAARASLLGLAGKLEDLLTNPTITLAYLRVVGRISGPGH